jgi:hypothetical protein
MGKVKSIFTGLASRKQRREEARKSKVEFAPQYNGLEPMKVQHKDVLKIQINEQKRKEKKNKKFA